MGSKGTMVDFGPSETEEFRSRYKNAKDRGVEVFTYKGNQYVLDYAKYLLEYLDANIKKDAS